jgi:carboxypeptidase family protein/TonB-dependent receptor-like protein
MKIRFLHANESIDKSRVIVSLLAVLALVLSSAFTAHAQVTTADVRGTIMDEQGAAVAGADVSITSSNTGYTRSMKSASDGSFSFTELPLGTYSIHATHDGFKAATQTGIVLHVNDSLVVNVSLKVGAVTESVTVEAAPIAVETTNGELSGLVQAGQVEELPLNGRNFMQLVTLVPGVAPAEAFSVTNKGLKGASDVSVSGSPSNGNQWLVDGANNNDTGSQRTILVYPSTEAIEEFKIERNSYGAEFGLMAGATVNLVTKSGTNDFHGSVYYSGRNDKLNAFDTELKAGCPTCPKNKFRGNDYGYTIGGPVKKNKIFFFFNQEWNKRIEGLTATNHVPTLGERTGNFADVAACPASAANKAKGVNDFGFPIDPVTGAPALHDPAGAVGNASFGSAIPSARLSPGGLLGLTQYPNPTLTYTSTSCPFLNWTASQNVPTPWREESARGDINLTKTLTLMLKFTNDSWQIGPPSNGFGWGSNALGVIDESWNQPGRIAAAKLSKTIGPTAVNDFQFSYSANRITIQPSNLALEQKLNDAIPTFFPLSGKRYGDKGPSIWFSGWGNAHLPSVWTISPWNNAQDLYTWQDDFSMVKSRHTLKFGAIYSRNSKNEQQSNAEFGGLFGAVGYNGCNGAVVPGQCANGSGNLTGYDVSDVLLKNMALNWSEASNININDIRWHNAEFYAADTFRMTSKLTVVYGVRYSLLPNPYFEDNLYTSFNTAAYNPALGNATCNGLLYAGATNPCPAGTGGMQGPNRALWNNNNHMFAPRLSFAYDPTGKGKWAIRAGAGQFFNRDRLFALQIGGSNPPFIGNFTTTNGRFIDSITQPGACAPNCFGTGLGNAGIGGETSNQMPNSWQYNFTVQHELFRNALLEVGYVGNHNVHWEIRSDINGVLGANRLTYLQDRGCSVSAANCPNANGVAQSANAARTALRPFGPLKGDNSLTYYTHNASSSYNSLQASFNMHFTRGSIFQLAYTWSKLISDTQLIDTPALNVDHYNPSASRGPDLLNRPHILVANVVYNLPTLQSQQKYIRGALGSWEASGIVNLASGPSLTPIINSIANIGDPSGTGSNSLERPMRVAGQPCRASNGDSRQWFNPNAYTMNGFALGQIGSSGVGICTGPGNSDVDMSLRKNFKLTERVKMQFSFDFFNMFNHPQYQASALNMGLNFNAPTLTVDQPSSAEFLDTAGNPIYPRTNPANPTTPFTGCGANHLASATGTLSQAWCAAKITNTTLNPGTFGYATGSRENGWRQLQYGLKFSF